MTSKKYRYLITVSLSLTMMWGAVTFLSSCGKANQSATGLNVQYQVINLSPDLGPVDLYIDFRKFNSSSYIYSSSSNYFQLTSIDTPLQIRPAVGIGVVSTSNLFNLDNILKPNTKYTLFITGLRSDKTLNKIFTTDTAGTPTVGRGKIRFVNASPQSAGLDVLANNTVAFANQKFNTVSSYMEIPAGNYDFKITPTGAATTILKDLPGTSIQDGRLYTIYSYGITSRTDSAAFNAAMITNH